MNTITVTSAGLRQNALMALSAIFVLAMLGAATPASADPRRDNDNRNWNNGREWNESMSWGEHERHARNWRRIHREPYHSYVYAPPPVVYYPPPRSPGFTLILPFDLR